MIATVTGQRIPHLTKANKVISKLPILVNGKKGNIYCNTPIGDGETVFDNFTIGQTIVVEDEGGFYRLSDDQSVPQGHGTTTQNIKEAFNGTYVKTTPEDICKRSNGDMVFQDAARLLANCINHMNANLDGNRFNSEDVAKAGMSLFIYLTK